jgi:hypothetical protein
MGLVEVHTAHHRMSWLIAAAFASLFRIIELALFRSLSYIKFCANHPI